MSTQASFLPQLRKLLPLNDDELLPSLDHAKTLSPDAASTYFTQLLGDSSDALDFISAFNAGHVETAGTSAKQDTEDIASPQVPPAYAPPPGAPRATYRRQMNALEQASMLRERDEQEMQNALQVLQYRHGIYNADIEPEHETDWPCSCDIHMYMQGKYRRFTVQTLWSDAVMYPGEKGYTDRYTAAMNGFAIFSSNPYARPNITSPYGYSMNQPFWGPQKPDPYYYTAFIQETIRMNNILNHKAQTEIDAKEPKYDIWTRDPLSEALGKLGLDEKATQPSEKPKSKMTAFRKSLGIKSSDERAVSKTTKSVTSALEVRDQIVTEENARWPDEPWRLLVMAYQQHMGMASKIRELRARQPIQYLHLLRAGYFEPIPVAWANQASNPLKFSIEPAGGWRGITPAWRGYEDTAEERLYWVLNHREDSNGARMKPDLISEMRMAQGRMARAVEPPPAYFDNGDTCMVQHTSQGYSKQVPPPPLVAFDRPELPTDDTMILLDISGSMDFDPQRPIYNEFLITGFTRSPQPKNKDVAKAIVRRFTDAMAHHDHMLSGYDLVTFSDVSHYLGAVHHKNLDQVWGNIRFGGGTRVMTGWQQVKERHFQKHSQSATYHPVYGWQAGPETPMLRLLLLLDGEATDMDEFELDLLGLSWAHVTIFLIGVDGCPHHHRHANELERIGNVNHHVSFVDAQGNFPERFVTHELLKRHLGYDISMQEFQQMEELPAYSEF